MSERNCAPLSPVTLKASAGASESIRLLSISQPQRFVEESQKNGWKFFAAAAPTEPVEKHRRQQMYISTSSLQCPPRTNPCVLMLGGEGEGLRQILRRKADYIVGVEGQRIGQGGVDSLNVSVAAGVLCEAFLRQPLEPPGRDSIASQDSEMSISDPTSVPIGDTETHDFRNTDIQDTGRDAMLF